VPPDAVAVQRFLARVGRRRALLRAADGAAIGFAVSALAGLAGFSRLVGARWSLSIAFIAASFGAFVCAFALRASRSALAIAVERRAPAFKNVLVTTQELPETTAEYVRQAVFAEAARLTRDVDPAVLFPARRRVITLGAGAAAWLAAVALPLVPPREPTTARSEMRPTENPTIDAVEVRIEPPAYTGLAPRSVRNPSRIEAIAGSRLEVTVTGRAERMIAETLNSRDTLESRGATFRGTVPADGDGFIAVESYNKARAGDRRLIALTVRPDESPRVRIVEPGHDQHFPGAPHEIRLGVEAFDDLALSALIVRYTKVSGSGERFTFSEGQVPISVSRQNDRAWTARASWALDSLHLEPGDMVVYRALASDRRPSSAPGATTESASYIVEIDAPGGVAAPGFEADPDQDRRAVSQQMVILETERLLARRATLSAEQLQNESLELAAEQRKVRVEFVFMLGGEFGESPDLAASMTDINEEQEAGHEDDLLAGHAANAGYVALIRAIRAMSGADRSLTSGDPAAALPHERAALAELEVALSRRRMLLRAFTSSERLDVSRRLTGSLADALSYVRPPEAATADARAGALRAVLADLASLDAADPSTATRAPALAERVLRVDPSSDELRRIADDLFAAGQSAHDARARDAAADRASTALVHYLRTRSLDAPGTQHGADARLQGAWRDALRARGMP
jgi:hypothetical protein